MDAEKLKALDDLLMADNTGAFRILFADGEIYDLDYFSIIQDSDDEPLQCSARVVQPINISERKLKFFKPDSGMLFLLSDVVEVRDVRTREVVFRS